MRQQKMKYDFSFLLKEIMPYCGFEPLGDA